MVLFVFLYNWSGLNHLFLQLCASFIQWIEIKSFPPAKVLSCFRVGSGLVLGWFRVGLVHFQETVFSAQAGAESWSIPPCWWDQRTLRYLTWICRSLYKYKFTDCTKVSSCRKYWHPSTQVPQCKRSCSAHSGVLFIHEWEKVISTPASCYTLTRFPH